MKTVAAVLTMKPELVDRWIAGMKPVRPFVVANAASGFDRPDADVFHTGGNHYFSGGWNAGLAEIRRRYPDAEYVWMCNDDAEGCTPEMCERLAWGLDTFEWAAMVSPALPGNPHWMMQPGPALWTRTTFTDFVCPMLRLRAWQAVGPLDNRFRGYGADIDWCLRARKHAWLFLIDHSQRVVHDQPGKTQAEIGSTLCGDWVEQFTAKWGTDDWVAVRDGTLTP